MSSEPERLYNRGHSVWVNLTDGSITHYVSHVSSHLAKLQKARLSISIKSQLGIAADTLVITYVTPCRMNVERI